MRAIAYAEDGDLAADAAEVDGGSVGLTDRGGAAGQDDAANAGVNLRTLVVGVYLAIDILLADTAADELRVLGAEV